MTPASRAQAPSSTTPSTADARIRAGVGGWTFEPWRGSFFPPGLPHSRELEYASRQLSAIEVNGTYYGTLKPASFKKWHDETPENFMFSLKASRYATNRRVLAEAGESIRRFTESGISELGDKLGPIVWQFMPGKVFEAGDFEAFLALLPKQVDGRALRHVVDVRHESFMSPDYLALARRYRVATVFTDADKFPSFADLTGDFAYARLMMSEAQLETGYEEGALDAWTERARQWAAGGAPGDLPTLEEAPAQGKPRDVFVYFINGAKERAPAAAMAFLKRLGFTSPTQG
ncbi:hypothetical protein PMI15_00173 [Polaromonas sp. CF318]|uniref:DUF72 domain-containing protein n=1 Tax=Polaromonas sp. CF318 TaxID=1144318 RepID=UPI000270F925|nr:DUF72 domain-containing protein [Polaromonas sp. CF318]EJL90922.1 hypothetical protein PMI15_00173 [Polaromonas sp. CF318]